MPNAYQTYNTAPPKKVVAIYDTTGVRMGPIKDVHSWYALEAVVYLAVNYIIG